MLPHQAILASAGSGKTHTLVTRVLRLLALGAEPSSITALTFTRKAAGEFASAVLIRLARASSDEAAASALAREIARPDWSAADFRQLLVRLVAELSRLRFGTIDSFFQQVLQAGAHEMGLPGGFLLLDEAGAKRARAEVLRSQLRRSGMSGEAALQFLEAFRLATYGTEERSLLRRLEAFLGECQEAYQASSAPTAWGDPATVFPSGSRFFPIPKIGEFHAALERLAEWAGQTSFGHKSIPGVILEFVSSLSHWAPGLPPPPKAKGFRAKLLEEADAVFAGGGRLEYWKKNVDLAPVAAELALVLRFYVGGNIGQKLLMTKGLREIVSGYESGYDARIRSTGRLGFEDVTRLVAGADGVNLAYRLDSSLLHWLLDEFQDTGREQWRGLAHFVGETLADKDGSRSAFFVGDLKQAIYAWRGGDHRLLPELLRTHGGISTERLDVSWRSVPAVLDMVNRLGHSVAAASDGVPRGVRGEWAAVWGGHVSAPPLAGLSGRSEWFVVEASEGGAEGPHLELLTALLAEADPVGRGLSCAVLTRTNEETAAAAAHLRAAGRSDVVAESDVAVALDNPVTSALLSVLRASAHPADTLSRGHAGLTPLAAWISQRGGWEGVRPLLLGRFAHDGAAGLLDWLSMELAGLLPSDPFSRRRLAQLRGLARDFDRLGERDLGRFCDFAGETRRRESGAEKCIQVMTIHKSKGLGFDVVYVVDKTAAPLDRVRPRILLSEGSEPPLWHLAWPGDETAEADPSLWAARDGLGHRHAYESLCLRYVALTRAKRSLTVITPPPGDRKEDGGTFTWPQLLEHALGLGGRPVHIGGIAATLAWESGDPGWASSLPSPAVSPAASPPPFAWGC